jgi:hemoglobin
MGHPTESSEVIAENLPSDYERIGGAGAVSMVVDRFYELVLGDPELAPFFEGTDVARVKRHQVLLISQILGGPARYTGPDLRSAHAGLRIGQADFDRVATHLVSVLEGAGVDPDIVARVVETVGGVRSDIVTVPAAPAG